MDPFGYPLPGSEVFEYLEEIGHGRFSEIYRGRRRDDNQVVALKYLTTSQKGELPVAVHREIQALQSLQGCPGILQYHGLHKNNFGVSLVLDLFSQDLTTFLLSMREGANQQMDYERARNLILQMMEAVGACHSHGIIHRDISPKNFLISNEGNVALADFGISIYVTELGATDRTPGMGTLWYMAPEILFGATEYTSASDIWSLGCIAAEMLLGKPLWNGSSQLDQICQIIDVLGTPKEEDWPGLSDLPDWGILEFPMVMPKDWKDVMSGSTIVSPDPSHDILRDVIQAMLIYDPCKRISIEECIQKIRHTCD